MKRRRFSRTIKKSVKILAAVSLLVCMVAIYMKYETSPVLEASKFIHISIPSDSEVVEWLDLRDGLPAKGKVYYAFQIKQDKMPALLSQTEGWTQKPPLVNMMRNHFHEFNVPPINDGRYYTNVMKSNERDFVVAVLDVKERRLYVLRVVM